MNECVETEREVHLSSAWGAEENKRSFSAQIKKVEVSFPLFLNLPNVFISSISGGAKAAAAAAYE